MSEWIGTMYEGTDGPDRSGSEYMGTAYGPDEPTADEQLVNRIEAIRTRNNGHWMSLLRLALEAEPERAKAILQSIEQCDGEVRQLMKELSES